MGRTGSSRAVAQLSRKAGALKQEAESLTAVLSVSDSTTSAQRPALVDGGQGTALTPEPPPSLQDGDLPARAGLAAADLASVCGPESAHTSLSAEPADFAPPNRTAAGDQGAGGQVTALFETSGVADQFDQDLADRLVTFDGEFRQSPHVVLVHAGGQDGQLDVGVAGMGFDVARVRGSIEARNSSKSPGWGSGSVQGFLLMTQPQLVARARARQTSRIRSPLSTVISSVRGPSQRS